MQCKLTKMNVAQVSCKHHLVKGQLQFEFRFVDSAITSVKGVIGHNALFFSFVNSVVTVVQL